MSFPLFTVKKTGLMTTFQDRGRYGYQSKGVVVSGAMDDYSFQMANYLVGNEKQEACIEMGMIGPTLLVEVEEVSVAITGASIHPTVNGREVPMWKAIRVKKGDVLSFPGVSNGVYAYLAVNGGFDIPTILGSKSYYNKANIGTPINKGDCISGVKPNICLQRFLTPTAIPTFPKEQTVRVIVGPHEDYFTKASLEKFFSTTFTVKQTDRMGARLEGASLNFTQTRNVLSDAIPLGGIQIPANGQPIILLADRQTTGGYPRIGTILLEDVRKIAQLPPGGRIHFQMSACHLSKVVD